MVTALDVMGVMLTGICGRGARGAIFELAAFWWTRFQRELEAAKAKPSGVGVARGEGGSGNPGELASLSRKRHPPG